jgi:proline racemase
MVPVSTPTTTIRLDTPAGLVVAEVAVRDDGAATGVTIHNVPSFPVAHGATVEVEGLGEVRYDLAYGGNFYVFVELAGVGLPFDRAAGQRLLESGMAIIDAIDKADPPVHPDDPAVTGCHGVYFVAPGSDARHSRHAMVIPPGWFDRSPCGTGTSARMAQLWSRGQLPLDTDFVNESFIGTRFVGRLVEETTVAGKPAVVPAVTGRAWITGTAQYLLDPEDPFPAGFLL